MTRTGFVWVILAFIPYGLAHSTLASLRAKALAERWFGHYCHAGYDRTGDNVGNSAPGRKRRQLPNRNANEDVRRAAFMSPILLFLQANWRRYCKSLSALQIQSAPNNNSVFSLPAGIQNSNPSPARQMKAYGR